MGEIEEEDLTEHRPRRIVESHSAYHHEGFMTLGTKILLILGLTVITGVGILVWVLGPVLRPTVTHAIGALGAYGWLWLDLLIITAIAAVAGLLRRFGFIKLIEDIVTIVLRVHEHFVTVRHLRPDKIGNYPLPLSKDGYLLIPPGNSSHPVPQAPMVVPGTVATRRAARTLVSEESQQQSPAQQPIVLPPPATLPQLNGPSQRSTMEDLSIMKRPSVEVSRSASPVWSGGETIRTFTRKVLPDRYDFIQELEFFHPSLEQLFMGRTATGPVLLRLEHMPHLVFAGPTGVGKSKILRMVFAQLIAVNVQVYMCDSHYIPYSKAEGLDWTPIEARLMHPPIRDYATSADFLEWLAYEELETRKARAYHQVALGTPIMAGIEELSGIIDAKPEAAKSIGILLRQGRKYGICLAIAAQDLLAKSIGLDSGMIENIQTGYYGGGDLRTAKIALGLENGEHLEEDDLGRGKVYLKTIQQRATLTRIPWPDNEAVEALCSWSQLPVHELVREPLLETEQVQAVYQPRQEGQQGTPSNIHPLVQPSRRGAVEKPIDPAHLEYVRNGGGFELSDQKLAKALETTVHQARRMKNIVRKERGLTEEQEQEEVSGG